MNNVNETIEIEDKSKLPDDVKDNIDFKVFKNSLLSIGFMCVLLAINALFLFASKNVFTITTKVLSIVSIIATIAIFEIAYKKDDGEYIINGIEALVFSIVVLFIPYLYVIMPINIRIVFMLMPVYFSIYYIFKSIIGYVRLSKEYLNSISDVKEILTEEENTSYIEEESTKTIKEKKKKEELKKELKKAAQKNNQNNKNGKSKKNKK